MKNHIKNVKHMNKQLRYRETYMANKRWKDVGSHC